MKYVLQAHRWTEAYGLLAFFKCRVRLSYNTTMYYIVQQYSETADGFARDGVRGQKGLI